MHSLSKISDWARQNGAERSFTRLFRSDFEAFSRSKEISEIELLETDRSDTFFRSMSRGDILVVEEKIFRSEGFRRVIRHLFRWEHSCKNLPIDESCGWSRAMKEISYFKKSSFFGKYDLPIPLKDAMGRDPEF